MPQASWPTALAIDSTGSSCSAAVAIGDQVASVTRADSPHGQAEILLRLVDRALGEAGLTPTELAAVAVTVGPGSFTGIRVGLAAAKGIAMATGARLIGITSFDAAAAAASRSACEHDHFLLVALESRREDLYVQFYDPLRNPIGEPLAALPAELAAAVRATMGARSLLISGDAAERAGIALSSRPHTTVCFDAEPLALGALRAALRLLRHGNRGAPVRPLYLRPADVTLPSATRSIGAKRP